MVPGKIKMATKTTKLFPFMTELQIIALHILPFCILVTVFLIWLNCNMARLLLFYGRNCFYTVYSRLCLIKISRKLHFAWSHGSQLSIFYLLSKMHFYWLSFLLDQEAFHTYAIRSIISRLWEEKGNNRNRPMSIYLLIWASCVPN